MNDQVQRLNASDPSERACYEQAFFSAFRRASSNRLIRSLWLWDDHHQRVSVRVPYEEQRIYVQRDRTGAINGGLAFNVRLRTFQSAAFGFAPPVRPEGCCEFLTFFTAKPLALSSFLRHWSEVFEDLRRAGFHTGYGTSAARAMPLYIRMGAEVLETRGIEGELRHFFRLALTRTSMRCNPKFLKGHSDDASALAPAKVLESI